MERKLKIKTVIVHVLLFLFVGATIFMSSQLGKSMWEADMVYASTTVMLANISGRMEVLEEGDTFPTTMHLNSSYAECTDIVWKNADKTELTSETVEHGKTYAVEVTIETIANNTNTYIFNSGMNLSNFTLSGMTVDAIVFNTEYTQVVVHGTVTACRVQQITEENYQSYNLTAEEADVFEGAYGISTAEDMIDFANLVNYKGKADISGVITAELDFTDLKYVSIGTAEYPFAGKMYGQKYRLKNIVRGAGIFDYIAGGAEIYDVIVDKSCSLTGYSGVAGFIRYAYGTGNAVIKGCGNEADITIQGGTSAAGILGDSSGVIAQIENCYNTGAITCGHTSGYAYAISGGMYTDKIKNCYNAGVLSATTTKYAQSTLLTDCYQIEEGYTEAEGLHCATAEEFASGKVAYLMNGKVNGGELWRQNITVDEEETIEADTHPVLDTTHGKVYFDGENVYANSLPSVYKLVNVSLQMDTLYQNGTFPKKAKSQTAQAICTNVTWNTTEKIANEKGSYEVTVTMQTENTSEMNYAFSQNILPENVLLNGIKAKSVEISEDGILQAVFDISVHKLGFVTDDNYHLYGLSEEEYLDYIDYRVITDAEGLMLFAEWVNAGNNSTNALIAEDIDMEGVDYTPIGKEYAVKYLGKFDGRGHRIYNWVFENTENSDAGKYIGLFRYVGGGADIRGIIMDKSCAISAYSYAAGIIGYGVNDEEPVYIRNCGNEASVSCVYGSVAGIVGGGSAPIVIENCYNAGRITVENGSSIAAFTRISKGGEIVNSFNAGEICSATEKEDSQGGFFVHENFKVENCYQLSGIETSLRDGIQELTTEQYASGEAAYLLNGKVSGVDTYRQTLAAEDVAEADSFPVLDTDHGKVYADGAGVFSNTPLEYKLSALKGSCEPLKKWDKFPQKIIVEEETVRFENITWQTTDTILQTGKTYQAQIVLSAGEGVLFGIGLNKDTVTIENASVIGVAVAEDGKTMTLTCEMTVLAVSAVTEDSYKELGFSEEEYALYANYYAIDSADALMEFAELVNTGSTNINGVLTADIDLTGKTWMSIGMIADVEVDENGNEILYGMYTGTFDGRGHRICNMQLNSENNACALFYSIADGAVIKNVLIDKSCKISEENYGVAGLVGMVYLYQGGEVRIEGCGNEMDILATEYAAGIVSDAWVENGDLQIENCYNSGNITADSRAAAIIGIFETYYAGKANIHNCLNTGSITDNTNQNGLFCYDDGYGAVNMHNCYHIENALHITEQTGVESVSEDMLAGGEVAYLLNNKENGGEIWRQNLQTEGVENADAFPILDRSHAKVYTDGTGNYGNEKLSCRINTVSMEIDLFGGSAFPDEAEVAATELASRITWDTQDIKVTAGMEYAAEIVLTTENEGDYFNPAITVEDVQINGENAESVTVNSDGTLTISHHVTAWNITGITADNYAEYGLSEAEYAEYAGWYAIGSENDIFAFAELVNGRNNACNAVLVSDIIITDKEWTPIGTMDKPYTGIFDGRGHEIKGMSITAEDEIGAGFFRVIKDASVLNLTIDGQLDLKAASVDSAAGIVSVCMGNVVLKNLINEVDITASEDVEIVLYAGGILGIANEWKNELTVLNCVNKGNILADFTKAYYAGGIAGCAGMDMAALIRNCINYGTIAEGGAGILGSAYDENGYFKGIYNCLHVGMADMGIANVESEVMESAGSNNYYLENSVTSVSAGNVEAIAVTAKQLASGEVTYLLNEKVSGAETFRQNLAESVDAYPVLEDSHARVYCNYVDCLGESVVYSNRAVVEETHVFDTEGICENCGYCEKDNIYYIGSREMLKHFANRINGGNPNRNAVLTRDITIGNTFKIGTAEFPYAGIFDGNGYSVYVSYEATADAVALFPHASGTVKNLKARGNITTAGKYAAGIVGISHGAKVENCISEMHITSSYDGAAMHGGIIGLCQGGNSSTSVANCAFTGSIKGAKTTDCAGIAGYCAGTVNIADSYVYAEFALNSKDNSSKAICGNGADAQVTNCYYLSGDIGDILGREKTAENFANGEVAYLLNGSTTENVIWYQNLGENAEAEKERYPSLVKNENAIVYYFAEYDKYSNNANWPETLITPIVVTNPVVSGVYGTVVEQLTISDGIVAESDAADAKHIEGTWKLTGENLSEILSVGTNAEYTLVFTPDEKQSYKIVKVTVIPQITPFTLTAENTQITLGEKLTANGAEQNQTVSKVQVALGDDKVFDLTVDTDYTISGNKVVNAGNYTLSIIGAGNYQGTVTADYTVASKDAGGSGNEGGAGTGGGSGNEGGAGTGGGSGNEGGAGTSGGSGNEGGAGIGGGSGNEGGAGTGGGSGNGNGNCVEGTAFEEKGICYMITTNGEVTVTGLANTALKTINIPATVTNDDIFYKVTGIATKAFKGNKKATKVIIGKNIKSIGASAFEKCKKLTNVTIGKNVQTIGKKAFYGSKKLKKITIKTSKLTNKTVGKQAFKGIHKNASMKVPKKKLKAYKSMLKKKGIGKTVKITK